MPSSVLFWVIAGPLTSSLGIGRKMIYEGERLAKCSVLYFYRVLRGNPPPPPLPLYGQVVEKYKFCVNNILLRVFDFACIH